MMNLEI